MFYIHCHNPSFPGGPSGKESSCQCRRHKRLGFDPWVGKIPWIGNGTTLQYSCLGNSMDIMGSSGSLSCGAREVRFLCAWLGGNPWVGKIPRRRKWQPTPVFLPGESHGQRSLAGYSPRGHKELDTLKLLSRYTSTHSSLSFMIPYAVFWLSWWLRT